MDGSALIFDRALADGTHHLYRVASDGTEAPVVFYDAPSGKDAATPAYSPDSLIVLAGVGTHSSTVRDVITNTLDPGLSTKTRVSNYPDTSFAVEGLDPVLSPRLSPDGTRLAVRSRQLWAVRRNMSLPPQFTQVGTQGVADSTATVLINVKVGLQSSITVSASDPESDALTYAAYFLQAGMTFDAPARTLTWTPPGPVGKTYVVKFLVTTASGGTDAILALLTTVSALGPSAARPAGEAYVAKAWPNPTHEGLTLTTPTRPGATVELTVFDLGGRRVATIRGPASGTVIWNGISADGRPAKGGLYLYRLEIGTERHEGKFALVR
jgi:hypothetical protein